jgi:hypothetical protein
LEIKLAVCVPRQQPGVICALFADEIVSWPTVLGDDLPQPVSVANIEPCPSHPQVSVERTIWKRLPKFLVGLGKALKFSSNLTVHPLRRSYGRQSAVRQRRAHVVPGRSTGRRQTTSVTKSVCVLRRPSAAAPGAG